MAKNSASKCMMERLGIGAKSIFRIRRKQRRACMLLISLALAIRSSCSAVKIVGNGQHQMHQPVGNKSAPANPSNDSNSSRWISTLQCIEVGDRNFGSAISFIWENLMIQEMFRPGTWGNLSTMAKLIAMFVIPIQMAYDIPHLLFLFIMHNISIL